MVVEDTDQTLNLNVGGLESDIPLEDADTYRRRERSDLVEDFAEREFTDISNPSSSAKTLGWLRSNQMNVVVYP